MQMRANVAHVPALKSRAARTGGLLRADREPGLELRAGDRGTGGTDSSENTHVFFFADHGDMHGSHGMFRKTNPYEESIRTPMLITGGQPVYGNGERAENRCRRTMWTSRLLLWAVRDRETGLDGRYGLLALTASTNQQDQSPIRHICSRLFLRGIRILRTCPIEGS